MSRNETMNERDDTPQRAGGLAPGQRWSLARKREVVLRLLRGASLDALSREVRVEAARLERWRDHALAGLEEGLRDRAGDPLEGELQAVKAKLGEALMENERLRIKVGHPGPFGRRRAKR